MPDLTDPILKTIDKIINLNILKKYRNYKNLHFTRLFIQFFLVMMIVKINIFTRNNCYIFFGCSIKI